MKISFTHRLALHGIPICCVFVLLSVAGCGALGWTTSTIVWFLPFLLAGGLWCMGCQDRFVRAEHERAVGQKQDSPDDTDGDGITDSEDNCPLVANPDQFDADGNGYGDACETNEFPLTPCINPYFNTLDRDGDGFPDRRDYCPSTPSADNRDSDGDGVGDACDENDDFDGDGVVDILDNCPRVPNVDQANANGNLYGDACETPGTYGLYDADGDGLRGGVFQGEGCGYGEDNCPNSANPGQEDTDADHVGNICDNCPDTPNTTQEDKDGDGLGDACSSKLSQADEKTDTARLSRDALRRSYLERFLVEGVLSPRVFTNTYPDDEPQTNQILKRLVQPAENN